MFEDCHRINTLTEMLFKGQISFSHTNGMYDEIVCHITVFVGNYGISNIIVLEIL